MMSLPVWLPGPMFLLGGCLKEGGLPPGGMPLGGGMPPDSEWVTFWKSDLLVLACWLKVAFCYGPLVENGLLLRPSG